MTLADQPEGADYVVAWISGDTALGEQLMEMGVTPGVRIRLLRGGDPLRLQVRGYHLSIRRADAACIELEG